MHAAPEWLLSVGELWLAESACVSVSLRGYHANPTVDRILMFLRSYHWRRDRIYGLRRYLFI
jgi:hypothetical protein